MSYSSIHRNVREVIEMSDSIDARDLEEVLTILTALRSEPTKAERLYVFEMMGIASQVQRGRNPAKLHGEPLKWDDFAYIDKLIFIVAAIHHLPVASNSKESMTHIDFVSWVIYQWTLTVKQVDDTAHVAHRLRMLSAFIEANYFSRSGFAKVAYNYVMVHATAEQLPNAHPRKYAVELIKSSREAKTLICYAMSALVELDIKPSESAVYQAFRCSAHCVNLLWPTIAPLVIWSIKTQNVVDAKGSATCIYSAVPLSKLIAGGKEGINLVLSDSVVGTTLTVHDIARRLPNLTEELIVELENREVFINTLPKGVVIKTRADATALCGELVVMLLN